MKHMRKLTLALIAVLALCATLLTAVADGPYRGPIPLYANRSTVNVYKDQDTDSKVIRKLKGAESVLPDMISDNGKWIGILVEDTKRGGQRIGWVQAKYLVDYYPIEFCDHEWSKWKVTEEPTCTESGWRMRQCKKCGVIDEGKIDKLGHSWGKWKVTKEATCAKKGERTRTCSVCGKKETEEYLDEHTYGSWEMTKEPTCTVKGERQHTCKVCGHVEKQTLDLLPHEYEYKIITETTDHSAGVRAKVCVNCGYTTAQESFDPEGTLRRGDKGEAVRHMQQLLVEQGYLNAGGADGIFGGGSEKALMKYQQDRGLNPDGVAWPQTLKDLEHDFGPWKVVKPMTRTESGERVRVCQGCGFEQHEAIDGGAVLEKGARGENVRAMQQIIKQVGYDAGSFDGIYGSKLDNALAGFAADNDMIVEKGKIRPADVDAVVNAWIEKLPAESWKGEGSLETPVDLALTVEPVGETDENGIASYSWSVTNLGSQKATFTALLLTFGEPNFQQENLVMVLDGLELKANADNSASGSFNVDANWGEGNLNFAALAVTDPEGAVWLSNTASFDNGASPAEKTVLPMDNQIDANRLADGIYPVSFNSGDVLVGASGVFMNAVHIYTEDCYDIAEIAALKVGDTIVIEGEPVPVLSIDENEYGYSVNEGEEARTFDLVAREASNCYVVSEDDDMSTYTERGVTTLVLAPTATFTDAWDIESDPVTTGYDGIVAALQESGNNYFVPHNTTLRVENGQVMEINRVYVP